MNRSELYLHTFDDLRSRVDGLASKYDALATTLLLRKLLLDGQKNLTDAVGGGDGPYEIVGTRRNGAPVVAGWLLTEEHGWDGGRWAQRFSYAETRGLAVASGYADIHQTPRASLSREEFLQLGVVADADHEWSVKQVIHLGAYVLGGIHAGVSTDEDQKLLEVLERDATQTGMSYLKETMMGIAATTLAAMVPVVTRMHDESPHARPEG